VALSALQVNVLVLNLGFQLPPPLSSIFETFMAAKGVSSSFVSFSCAVLFHTNNPADTFYWVLVIALSLPLLLACVAVLFLVLMRCVLSVQRKTPRTSQLKQYFFTGSAVVFFTLHPSFCQVALEALSCTAVDPLETDFRLSSDYAVHCNTPEYRTLVWTLAIPILILYVIGAPLAAIYYLKANHEKKHFLQFLTSPFPRCYYWWAMVMFRKLIFSAIITLLYGYVVFQLAFINILLLACLMAHLWVDPFENVIVSRAESASLILSACIFASTTVFYTEQSHEMIVFFAYFLMLLMLLYLIAVFYFAYRTFASKTVEKVENVSSSGPIKPACVRTSSAIELKEVNKVLKKDSVQKIRILSSDSDSTM
jgi:hypothetical protein